MTTLRMQQLRLEMSRLTALILVTDNATTKAVMQEQLDTLIEEYDTALGAIGGVRLAPVANAAALAALPFEGLLDKMDCFVEAENCYYAFNAQAASGDVAPDDIPAETNGYWIKVLGETKASLKVKLGISASSTPATSGAAGTTGDIAWDATHIYVCVATNTWVRATLAAW